jgi:hypothetical protein
LEEYLPNSAEEEDISSSDEEEEEENSPAESIHNNNQEETGLSDETVANDETSQNSSVRQSIQVEPYSPSAIDKRNIIEGKRTRKSTALLSHASKDPDTFNEAMQQGWEEAIKSELNSLIENGTWGEPCELPHNYRALKTKWVFKTKIDAEGNFEKKKARLVAKGYQQREGIDFDDIFAPVARIVTIRILLILALYKKWSLFQADVVTAYLYAELDKEIYFEIPEGYELVANANNHKHIRAHKGLYGLKQSGKLWNDELKNTLREYGFIQSRSDLGLYIRKDIIIIVYVDDLLIAAETEEAKNELIKHLSLKYKIKDLGLARSILGVHLKQEENVIKLNQSAYLQTIVTKFGQENAKTSQTPMEKGLVLSKVTNSNDQYPYREAIGSLLYASGATRPDLAFATNYLGRFADAYDSKHWEAIKRVIRYIKETHNFNLVYNRPKDLKLEAYVDANFLTGIDDTRATSGIVLTIGGNIVFWKSSKQKLHTLSTAEAEINALAEGVKEIIWMQNLLQELNINSNQPTMIYEDNQAAIKICENQNPTGRTKHIAARVGFINDHIQMGTIKLEYCQSEYNKADGLTKPLERYKLHTFTEQIQLERGSVGSST